MHLFGHCDAGFLEEAVAPGQGGVVRQCLLRFLAALPANLDWIPVFTVGQVRKLFSILLALPTPEEVKGQLANQAGERITVAQGGRVFVPAIAVDFATIHHHDEGLCPEISANVTDGLGLVPFVGEVDHEAVRQLELLPVVMSQQQVVAHQKVDVRAQATIYRVLAVVPDGRRVLIFQLISFLYLADSLT